MGYMTIRIKRKLSLVLLPVDDFTDRIIAGPGIRMYTAEGGHPSLRKEEGYHVFCDLPGDRARICVEGPLYQRRVLELPLTEEPEVIQVRMIPGEGYPIPEGATCISGNLAPGSLIRLYFPEQKKCCKLLYDYDARRDGKELSLFQQEPGSLEGQTLCISDKEGKGEFFRIRKQEGERCHMEHPLSGNYKKIGTTVYRVYEACAKEDGSIYLLIRNLPGTCSTGICVVKEGDEEKCFPAELTAGKKNRTLKILKKGREE